MEIVVRASVVFFFLFVLLRASGKRTLAEMTAFDIVVIVVLGDLVQQGVTQEDYSVTGAFLAAGTMVFWATAISYGSFRSKAVATVASGFPIVVVRDGQVIDEALEIERLPRDELLEAAREQGIEDLDQIKIALLEPEGNFSFIRR